MQDEARYTRHDTVPNLAERDATINANYYNMFQLAINRLGEPVRLTLPGLKVLDFILQKDAFIVIDRVHNDVPVMAWCGFDANSRTALAEPVACKQRWYHIQASMITKRALETAVELLSEKLDVDPGNSATVLELHEKTKD